MDTTQEAEGKLILSKRAWSDKSYNLPCKHIKNYYARYYIKN